MATPGPKTTHPPGCYYVNPITQSVQRECSPLQTPFLAFLGFFGQDGTPAGVGNAFPTFEEALQWGHATHSGTVPGGGGILGTPGQAGSAFQSDWGHLMTRGAEFVIGAILVIVGLSAVLRRSSAGQQASEIMGSRYGV
jgi:hypothetical protein